VTKTKTWNRRKTILWLEDVQEQLHMFSVFITLLILSGARSQGGQPDCQVQSDLHLVSIKTVKI